MTKKEFEKSRDNAVDGWRDSQTLGESLLTHDLYSRGMSIYRTLARCAFKRFFKSAFIKIKALKSTSVVGSIVQYDSKGSIGSDVMTNVSLRKKEKKKRTNRDLQ